MFELGMAIVDLRDGRGAQSVRLDLCFSLDRDCVLYISTQFAGI